MGNNKMIKTAAAVALGASVVATAVAPGAASAATTYKLKSGKLVNAKTGKVVKGYKVYKSTLYKDGKKAKGYVSFGKVLYKNGKKFTGLRSAKYYKAGKVATGTYKGVYYKTGKKFTGLKSGVYYKSGVKGTGSYKSVYYKNGKKHTGLVGATYYKAGKKGTGSYKGIQYKSGKAVNGLSGDTYYKNGVKASGEVDGVQYFDGAVANGTFHSKLYVDGKVFEGTKEGKLYVAGKVFSGVNPADQKVYVDGVLDETAPAITVAGAQKVAYGASIDEASFVTSVKDNSGEEIKAVVTSNKIDTTKPGNYTVTYTATDKNGNVGKASVEVTVQAPAVESVKAINANELQVTFAQAVTATALNGKNYEVTINGTKTQLDTENTVNADIILSEDGKTATVRLLTFTPFKAGDKISLQILDGVTTKEGAKIARFASDVLSYAPTAPTVVKATAKAGATDVYVTFDRPVAAANASTLIKIDGYEVAKGLTALTASASTVAGNYTYKVSLSALTEAQKKAVLTEGEHTVTLFDIANTTPVGSNPAVAANLSVNYTVSNVESAPKVLSVAAVNANKFFIEFDQPIKGHNFKVEASKGTLVFNNELAANVATKSSSLVVDPTLVTYNGKDGYFAVITGDYNNGTDINPLYKGLEKTADVTIKVSEYKSAADLLGTVYTQTVSFSKDANKPKVVTQSIDSGSTVITLKFDQALDATTFDASKIVLKDSEGVIVKQGSGAGEYAVAHTGNTVTLTVTSGSKFEKEPYTVEFAKEAVQYAIDKTSVATYSLVANKNDAFSVTVGKKAADNTKFYALKDSSVPTRISSVAGTNNKIIFNYGTEMSDNALDVANYKLDGAALPAGSKVEFYQDKKQVLITLPEGSFKTTAAYRLTVGKEILTKVGQQVVKDAQSQETYVEQFTAVDNVAPTLTGAKFYVASEDYKVSPTTDTIELKFSEAIKATADSDDDVKITINNQTFNGKLTVSTIDPSVAYFKLDGTQTVNVTEVATITLLAETDQKDGKAGITDEKSNKAVAGSVTVSGKSVDATASAALVKSQAKVAAEALLNDTKLEYQAVNSIDDATKLASAKTASADVKKAVDAYLAVGGTTSELSSAYSKLTNQQTEIARYELVTAQAALQGVISSVVASNNSAYAANTTITIGTDDAVTIVENANVPTTGQIKLSEAQKLETALATATTKKNENGATAATVKAAQDALELAIKTFKDTVTK